MPKGQPKAGFRMTKKRINSNFKAVENILYVNPHKLPANNSEHAVAEIYETDDEIRARITERFDILQYMTEAAIAGDIRSMIVSGPAGLGKSYTVLKALENSDSDGNTYRIVKGYLRPPSLYRLLYQHRMAGQVLVFDDADEIFSNETTMNLLKAVCDTTERRVVSYMTEALLIDEEGAEPIPKSFQFDGTIIFITNKDFELEINRGNKLAPHFEALMSRSHYLDAGLHTRRDYLIRMMQVIDAGMLSELSEERREAVIQFIHKNSNNLRELSLRIALKIASLAKNNANFEKIAKITCCKNVS